MPSSIAPTSRDIARLVAYLPRLYAPGFQPIVRWGGEEPDAEGNFAMPWPEYDPLVVEFFQCAAQACWSDYDYHAGEASRMLSDAERVAHASLDEIKTMLTFCARGERFYDGHWGAVIEQGKIRALLERLQQILAEQP